MLPEHKEQNKKPIIFMEKIGKQARQKRRGLLSPDNSNRVPYFRRGWI